MVPIIQKKGQKQYFIRENINNIESYITKMWDVSPNEIVTVK